MRIFLAVFVAGFMILAFVAGVFSWLHALSCMGAKETEQMAEQLFWNGLSAFEYFVGLSAVVLVINTLEDLENKLIEANNHLKNIEIHASRTPWPYQCRICGVLTIATNHCGTATSKAR